LAWPEIKAALETGHSLKTIWERLQADGMEIRYNRLSEYVARLRRGTQRGQGGAVSVRPTAAQAGENQRATPAKLNATAGGTVPWDPAANLIDRLGGTTGFAFEGTGRKEDLI
jgi:hypothetical protein